MHTKTHIPKDHHWFAPFIQIASGFALTLISRVHNAFDFFTIFLSLGCLCVFFVLDRLSSLYFVTKIFANFRNNFFEKKMKGWLHQNCSRSPQHLGEIGQAKDYPFWKKRNEIDFKEKWYVNFIFEDIIGYNLGVLFKHSLHILQSYFELHFVQFTNLKLFKTVHVCLWLK